MGLWYEDILTGDMPRDCVSHYEGLLCISKLSPLTRWDNKKRNAVNIRIVDMYDDFVKLMMQSQVYKQVGAVLILVSGSPMREDARLLAIDGALNDDSNSPEQQARVPMLNVLNSEVQNYEGTAIAVKSIGGCVHCGSQSPLDADYICSVCYYSGTVDLLKSYDEGSEKWVEDFNASAKYRMAVTCWVQDAGIAAIVLDFQDRLVEWIGNELVADIVDEKDLPDKLAYLLKSVLFEAHCGRLRDGRLYEISPKER